MKPVAHFSVVDLPLDDQHAVISGESWRRMMYRALVRKHGKGRGVFWAMLREEVDLNGWCVAILVSRRELGYLPGFLRRYAIRERRAFKRMNRLHARLHGAKKGEVPM